MYLSLLTFLPQFMAKSLVDFLNRRAGNRTAWWRLQAVSLVIVVMAIVLFSVSLFATIVLGKNASPTMVSVMFLSIILSALAGQVMALAEGYLDDKLLFKVPNGGWVFASRNF